MATPKSVSFHTLGCKLNFSESSSLSKLFEKEGFDVVKFGEPSDFFVLNTCSVTDFADKKNRKVIKRIKRINPSSKIIVTGCYAQLKPKEISEIEGVDLVLGAGEKFQIVDYVYQLSHSSDKAMVRVGAVTNVNSFEQAFSFGNRTRSFLKIQDGCDYKCTFCTIPQARGKSRSDTIENVLKNAKQLVSQGVKEIVLTGVNIGDFGNGQEIVIGDKVKKEENFFDLIKALDAIEGIERFRISSIEPNLLTDEIIEFVAKSKRFVPHFHIPLQSGNDKQLQQMKRRYKSELYRQRIKKIKALIPHCCIGVDTIVGFPGETDEDFLVTQKFLEDLPISYLHVFTYSERANTPAIEMEDVVPMSKRKKRNAMLTTLSNLKKFEFYEQFIGESHQVLFEKHKKHELMTGFTENYLKVVLPLDADKLNTIGEVVLRRINKEDMVFEVLKVE